MSDKNKYSKKVKEFKNKWCNENTIISKLLQQHFKEFLQGPILDIGAGQGDIGAFAFEDKETYCIDLTLPSLALRTNLPKHVWIQTDFFDYSPAKQIKTVFISHTQQFLDDRIDLLISKMKEISPKNIITVSNDNDAEFGEIVNYTLANFPKSNPEISIPNFPDKNYQLEKSHTFYGLLKCESFEILAQQISYLMVNNTSSFKKEILLLLKGILKEPQIKINQTINAYVKQSR